MPSVPPELEWPADCYQCGVEVVGFILCCGVYRCVDPCHLDHEASPLHEFVTLARILGQKGEAG